MKSGKKFVQCCNRQWMNQLHQFGREKKKHLLRRKSRKQKVNPNRIPLLFIHFIFLKWRHRHIKIFQLMDYQWMGNSNRESEREWNKEKKNNERNTSKWQNAFNIMIEVKY